MLIYKICPVCNKLYMTDKINNRRYCSTNCMKRGLILQKQQKQNGTYKLDIRQPVEAVHENGVNRLKCAIIVQAIKDYKKTLKSKGETSAISFERFFKSAWGQMLSDNNGDYIIKHCKGNMR